MRIRNFGLLKLEEERTEQSCTGCHFKHSESGCLRWKALNACIPRTSWQVIGEAQTFYALRHTPSQSLMPTLGRSGGYTHWNPWVAGWPGVPTVPRLFATKHSADTARGIWKAGRLSVSSSGERSTIPRHEGELEIIRVQVGYSRVEGELY